MKLTNQPTTLSETLIQYSKPLTKEEIAEIWVRVYPGDCKYTEKLLRKFSHAITKIEDATLVREFNRTFNLRIRLFAPGKFQIVYNGIITLT